MGKISNFLRKTKAKLTGDAVSLLAIDNEEKAIPTVDGQIANIQFKLVEQKGKVKDAERELDKAKYPTIAISSGNEFYKKIVDAQKHLDEVKEGYRQLQESLEYAQALKKEFEEQVEEA